MNISPTFRITCLLGCSLMILAAGCSAGNNDGTTVVYGTVTYDGSPLESGKVILEPIQADGRPHAGSIHNGQFQLHATPGKKIVRITATRVEDPSKLSASMKRTMEVGGEGTVPVQFIPARYNRESDLTVEIDADGGNELSWDLTK